eukprot:4029949-Alexandrium_andersonii.AAC.1
MSTTLLCKCIRLLRGCSSTSAPPKLNRTHVAFQRPHLSQDVPSAGLSGGIPNISSPYRNAGNRWA